MLSVTNIVSRPIRILLVEDNLGDVTLIMEAFKDCQRPVQITRVKDGEEALQYLRKEGRYNGARRPDLIMLDLNMPKKSGFEVLDEVKADDRFKDIPVVVLTNSRLDSDMRKAYDSRASFYLVKPADLDELFAAAHYIEDIWLKSVMIEED